jgi:prolyl-tRNA synthetase
MGTVVELLADAAGIVWPESIAPFDLHLILIAGKEDTAKARAEHMYTALTKTGVEVLYDERDARAGEKFADSDLIGIPYRAVVSEKALTAGTFELKNRATGAVEQVTEEELIARFTKAAAERRTQQ